MTSTGAPAGRGAAAGGPVIDTHQHVWDLSAHDQPWLASDPALAPLLRSFTLAELAPLAAAEGVMATVVVQTVAESWETPELLALATGPGLPAGVVGWADLTAPDVADVLAGLRELPGGGRLAGIRHPVLAEPDPDWLARPEVLRGLSALAAAGLAYDVVGEPRHLPAAVTAAREVPGLRLVLDHLGNPTMPPGAGPAADEPWATAFTQLAALPNTTAKLSGVLSAPLPQLRRYYDCALHAFGPNRLMFGSDWPPCTLEATYSHVCATARTLTAELSESERHAIFSGTARHTYRLP